MAAIRSGAGRSRQCILSCTSNSAFLADLSRLLCLALFLGVGEASPESRPFAAAIVLAVVIILGTQIAWEAGHNLVALAQNAKSSDWLIAKDLESRGIHAGDKVATIGELPSIYWGRLAGVTLTGEISADDAAAFWAATPDLKAQIAGALSQAGIGAIVADGVPQSAVSRRKRRRRARRLVAGRNDELLCSSRAGLHSHWKYDPSRKYK